MVPCGPLLYWEVLPLWLLAVFCSTATAKRSDKSALLTKDLDLLSFVYVCLFVLDRLYTDKHEWIAVDGKIGTVGASQYAQVEA